MHAETDTPGVLADRRALLERVVDAHNAVLAHGQEEAAAELRLRRAGVEEGRRGVREEFVRHHFVGLERARDVLLVDANRDAHDHVLQAAVVLAVATLKVTARGS